MRGDDGFGPMVVEKLSGRTSLSLIDAAVSPENALGPICKAEPSEIVIIDAVYTEASVGQLCWLEPDELDCASVSTHSPSLDLMVTYLRHQGVDVPVYIIGTSPQDIGLGSAVSPAIESAVDNLVSTISQIYPPCG